MFQSIQRRASRIGTTTSKFILTIDLQTLELYHDEHLYPVDTLVSLTLERGAKFSSSSEKEIAIDNPEVNPLNKRISAQRKSFANSPPSPHIPSAVSKITWNERLELVATLYRDAASGQFQEKDAVLKLKTIGKGEAAKGLDKYQTVGKIPIQLHTIVNRLLSGGGTAPPATPSSSSGVLSMIHEEEVTMIFQNFKKTALTFLLRITPLNNSHHPSFSNPFNQFIYNVNNSPSHSLAFDTPQPHIGGGGGGEDVADNASVSSYLSHDNESEASSRDIGFEYADLRETRPMMLTSAHLHTPQHSLNLVTTPSHIVETIRRTSLTSLATPQRRGSAEEEAPNKNNEEVQHENDVAHARDQFYSSYGVRDAATKLGRSRSMIGAGAGAGGTRDSFSRGSTTASMSLSPRAGGGAVLPVQSLSLSGLFPTATTSEDDQTPPPPPAASSSSRSPKLSPKSTRGKRRVSSPWVMAMFRTLVQSNALKENHIARLESEIHVINQTNYIEKLELIKRLEDLQHEMAAMMHATQLQQQSAAKETKETKEKKSRSKSSANKSQREKDKDKDKEKKRKKKSPMTMRSFFSSSKVEAIAEVDEEVTEGGDEVMDKEVEGSAKANEAALTKTIQKTEETIESFRKSIESNIQTIQQVALIMGHSSASTDSKLDDVEVEVEVEGEAVKEEGEDVLKVDSVDIIVGDDVNRDPTDKLSALSVTSRSMSKSRAAYASSSAVSLDDDDSRSIASTVSAASTQRRSIGMVSAEKHRLLEYELSHCKALIQTLEKGREEDQLLIREVANRVTDNCMKRATSEWELEKARNQLLGYKAMNEQFKEEYATLQQKYLMLKKKMKKSRQQLTNMEVQFEYRNSLQDIRQMSDALSPPPDLSSFTVTSSERQKNASA